MIERKLSYLFLLISVGYTMHAAKLSFGALSSPRAGFLPTIAGGVAIILALMIVAGKDDEESQYMQFHWQKFFLITIGLFFYLVCLFVIGYIMATFLIMLYLLKSMELQGWSRAILISAAVAVGFYELFGVLLSITLP